MRVVCILFQKPTVLQPVAEVFYRLTPQICIRGEEALFLEIGQCRKLYSEKNLILRIAAALERLNLKAKISVADDAPTALAKGRFETLQKMNLPVTVLQDFASPFLFDPLVFKECAKMISTLERLGVRALADFLKLPVKSLASRFGSLGVLLHQRVQDAQTLPWPKFTPVEKVVERMDWGHEISCDTLDSIFFYVKTLLDRTLIRLFGRGERLLSFNLNFEYEKHSLLKSTKRSWLFDLNLPHGTSKNILPLVRDKISFELGQRPLESLVNALELQVVTTAPSFSSQKDLLNPKKEEEQEAWNNLITRLTQKLGKEKIFCAQPCESYLPEQNWRAHMSETISLTPPGHLPFPQRPMRLLKEPCPTQFDGQNLVLDQAKKKVVSFFGPEVLAGEWWEESFERTYYRVLLEKGEQFWVFQSQGQFFVHGIYD